MDKQLNIPLISVVMCCYNSEKYLGETLDSLREQSFTEFELIIINDGSDDSTEIIINEYLDKFVNFKYFSQPNLGLNNARNKGLSLTSSKSQYVIFVDSDDLFDIKFLDILFGGIRDNVNAVASYCGYQKFDQNGIINGQYLGSHYSFGFGLPLKSKDDSRLKIIDIISDNFTLIEPSILIKKSALLEINGWDEVNFPRGETYGESAPLLIKLLSKGEIVKIKQKLYWYRQHPGQITSLIRYKRLVVQKIYNDHLQSFYNVSNIKMIFIFFNIGNRLIRIRGSFLHNLRFNTVVLFFDLFIFFIFFLFYNIFFIMVYNNLRKLRK
jgi:glycosyltransferase involved in cell wall biosynthesis